MEGPRLNFRTYEIRATATFMQKPFAPAQLAAKIREVIDAPPVAGRK